MTDEIPQEDVELQKEQDLKPPRFMVVLKDFQTDTQIQVGAPDLNDFLKPLPQGKKRNISEQIHHVFTRLNLRKITTEQAVAETTDLMELRERFELERVFRYFGRKVKQAEKDPWPDKSKKKEQDDVEA